MDPTPAENANLDLEKRVSNDAIVKKISNAHIADSSSDHASTSDAEKSNVSDIEKGKEEKKDGPQTAYGNDEDDYEYPSNKKLVPIMGGLYLAFFLVALVCFHSPIPKMQC